MKKLIVVADWAEDALKCQEFRTAVEGFLRDPSQTPNISFVPIKQSSIQAGFNVFQIAETELRYGRPAETVVFVMSDNRIHGEEHNEIPEGEPFFIARLPSAMYICGPNAGFSFSFIKPKIERVFTYSYEGEAANNRSRDAYPKILAYLMDALEDDLELEEAHTNLIPEQTEPCVLDIDSFGNITLFMKKEELKGKAEINEEVEVTINGVTKRALYIESLFADHEGRLVIYPGTSGYPDNPFLEVGVWNGNAAQEFGDLKIGDAVKIG